MVSEEKIYREEFQSPCTQWFSCNTGFLFPVIQINVEERTGNPEHLVVLEVEVPKEN